jgi:surfeit locus 1 family protein
VTAPASSVRTVSAVAGLALLGALFIALGAWQLQRATATRDIAAQFRGATASAPLREPPPALGDVERFRRLEVRGTYVAEPQFLLDNMLHDGMAGYQVLTPLRVAGASRWLLVNRGWVPAGPDRRVLPEVAVSGAERTVAGRVERLPRPGMRLGDPAANGSVGGVMVVEFPTAADLAGKVAEPLFDYQLLLDPAAPDGYVRDWRAPGISPERHLSYAGQWWLFAAGALGAAATILVKSLRRRT